MIKGHDIICFSSLNYEEHTTAKQQIMNILSENNRVFFVQKEICAEHLLKHPGLIINVIKNIKTPYYKKNNINIINLPLLFPGRFYYNSINKINQKRIYKLMMKYYKLFNITNPILWTFMPNSAPLFKMLPSKLKIYHCAENYNILAGEHKKQVMQTQEDELCEVSDLIFCVTQGIYNKISGIAPDKSHLVYNGVDTELFNKSASVLEEPEDLKSISHPRLIHMGMVNGKVDLDLVYYIANTNHKLNLIFIGNIFYSDIDVNKFYKIKKLGNVHFLGQKNVDVLPYYLSNCDICLIIGKKNNWTSITKPLKSYEYLASGKPIVSIGFPELENFSEYIYISENYAEYMNNIKEILNKKRKTDFSKQIEFANHHSWKKRVEQISEIITDCSA